MSYISDNHKCGECGAIYTIIVKRAKRDEPSTCPQCMEEGRRTLSAPAIMSAAYPDGRKRGDTYQKLKEAAKLEVEASSMQHDKRGDIKREIKELKK